MDEVAAGVTHCHLRDITGLAGLVILRGPHAISAFLSAQRSTPFITANLLLKSGA